MALKSLFIYCYYSSLFSESPSDCRVKYVASVGINLASVVAVKSGSLAKLFRLSLMFCHARLMLSVPRASPISLAFRVVMGIC